jgi:hypothetical protein
LATVGPWDSLALNTQEKAHKHGTVEETGHFFLAFLSGYSDLSWLATIIEHCHPGCLTWAMTDTACSALSWSGFGTRSLA